TLRPKVAKPKAARGSRVSLRVTLTGKGRLTASGSGLTRTARSVGNAGTYTLRVGLSKRAAVTLKRKRRFATTARVTFTPTGGKPSSVRVRVMFVRGATVKSGSGAKSHSLRRVSVLSSAARKSAS